MEKFTYTITDPAGIHARPAGLLVTQTGCAAELPGLAGGTGADRAEEPSRANK